MDVDAILYHQDAEMIVDVDADVIQVHYLAETTTAVCGLSYFSSSVVDVAETHGETADATIAVSGSSFFSSSAAEVEIIVADADATTVDVNKILLKGEEYSSPFFHIYLQRYKKECLWNIIHLNL